MRSGGAGETTLSSDLRRGLKIQAAVCLEADFLLLAHFLKVQSFIQNHFSTQRASFNARKDSETWRKPPKPFIS